MTRRNSPFALSNKFEIEVDRLTFREWGFGHRTDDRIRGRILAYIDLEAGGRYLDTLQIHNLLGLPHLSLDRGTLTTERLQQALDDMRALPDGPSSLWPTPPPDSYAMLAMVSP